MTQSRAVHAASWRNARRETAREWWGEWQHVLAGGWQELRGAARVLVGRVTHNDVMRVLGHRQRLVGALQRHYREGRATVEQHVDVWLCRNVPQLFGPLPSLRIDACLGDGPLSNTYAENLS